MNEMKIQWLFLYPGPSTHYVNNAAHVTITMQLHLSPVEKCLQLLV